MDICPTAALLSILSMLGDLALQLPFCSKVSALRDGLMRPSPERPRNGMGGLNALSSKSDGDAADFLDRPADQRRRGGVFVFAGRRRVVLKEQIAHAFRER